MFRFFRRSPRTYPGQISYEELRQDISFAFGNKAKKYFDFFDSKYTVNVLENMEQHQLLQMVSLLAQSFMKTTCLDVSSGHTSQIISMLLRVIKHVQNLEDTIVLCESGISLPLDCYIVSVADLPPAYSIEDNRQAYREGSTQLSALIDKVGRRHTL